MDMNIVVPVLHLYYMHDSTVVLVIAVSELASGVGFIILLYSTWCYPSFF
jgi:hypothetical protein